MRNIVEPMISVFIGIYVFLSIIMIFGGIVDKSDVIDQCEHPKNYSIMFPAYKLGCWLGEEKK